jgi:hypothetical protein
LPGSKLIVGDNTPGASLLVDLHNAGVDVDVMSTKDQAAACGRFIDACMASAPLVRHAGHTALRKALALAQTKPHGDGGVSWSRRTTSGDISPLTAVTMAYGRVGVATGRSLPEPFVVFD